MSTKENKIIAEYNFIYINKDKTIKSKQKNAQYENEFDILTEIRKLTSFIKIKNQQYTSELITDYKQIEKLKLIECQTITYNKNKTQKIISLYQIDEYGNITFKILNKIKTNQFDIKKTKENQLILFKPIQLEKIL